MNRRIRLVVVALAGGVGLWFAASGVAAGPPAKHTVTIEATSYKPETITVKKGESVTWINKDPFPHTVTAAGNSTRRASPPTANGPIGLRRQANSRTSARCTRT
jgi:plastocyanin